MLSPLSTRRIWLEEINIALSPQYTKGAQDDYDVKVDIKVRKRSDAQSFRIRLTMRFTPAEGKQCRYSRIAFKTIGIFELPDDAAEDLIKAVIPLNCLAILHGFARGVIAQITGLNDGGPFLLPTTNFHDALKQKIDNRTRQNRNVSSEADKPT